MAPATTSSPGWRQTARTWQRLCVPLRRKATPKPIRALIRKGSIRRKKSRCSQLSPLRHRPPLDEVSVEGIEQISLDDVNFAKRRGYAIRLLAIAERIENKISLRVHPTLVRLDSSLASVCGVRNAILYQGDFSGQVFLAGQGAGAAATASAVAGDILDIARGRKTPMFGMPHANLAPLPFFPLDDIVSPWYLHFRVQDKVGVVATIATILSECNISLSAILQDDTRARQQNPLRHVSLLLWTHRTATRAVARALCAIEETSLLQEQAVALRILEEDRRKDREEA